MSDARFRVFAGVLTVLLLGLVAHSVTWPMHGDTPILSYIAWAVDETGRRPYADLFDFNLPGTYAIFIATGRVFGYGQLGMRLADLLCLATLAALTWRAMRGFGWKSAWCATVVFPLVYLGHGQSMSFQREFLLLLPLAACVTLLLGPARRTRLFLVGLLLGIMATIKLQSLVVAPLAVWWVVADREADAAPSVGSALGRLAACGIGFVIPPAAAAL